MQSGLPGGSRPQQAPGRRNWSTWALALRRVRSAVGHGITIWRRSIQFRVVSTTLVLSAAVMLLLGIVVVGQVQGGLLDAKVASATAQAQGGFQVARANAAAQATDGVGLPVQNTGTGAPVERGFDAKDWLTTLVDGLSSGGTGQYDVAVLSPETNPSGASRWGPRSSGNVLADRSVPDELRKEIANRSGAAYQFTKIVRESAENRGTLTSTPGVVVGAQLTDPQGAKYQLYYFFPFTPEEETLSLVRGTLATAGVFLVLLLVAIAALVTRQVVTPVRMAARIAERLAAGRLEERMRLTGEDDLARLGSSFNKMASNLQNKIRQLEDLSRMQRRFVSDVSHELRTPLTTVRMAADVLHEAREGFDPAVSRSAELLQTQLDRFEALLSDLLEISRFDAGAAVLDAESVDLRDLVGRVVDAAEPIAERRGGRIVVAEPGRPCVAEVDPRRIDRVLRNLVVNAVEHGEGRDVVVTVGVDDGAVAVTVRDYGVGLKPGESSLVFNRFWRADPARARTTGGTGLGLSIALEDAHLHGGWLQAWGEPGGGSQFRLALPRVAGADLVRSPLPLEPPDSRANRGLDLAGTPYRRTGRTAEPGTAPDRSPDAGAPASGTPAAGHTGGQSGPGGPGGQNGPSSLPGGYKTYQTKEGGGR
ncbi:HAMP domain-containing histidine kinase [Yinghuangia sp. KLBMP8922]|uniref:Sensor histidine kinase MtrB n=2 Tax=Yinghuangia soli TaxID=2908204 RepID=A0AA41U4P2_9ACTN|nr:HAMP domain-containing histidine kinase [Yinghuangia soli]